MKTYSLYELNEHIRRILALNLPEAIWVSCEIAQLNPSRGHYFLALVEKGETKGEVLAHSEAVIWQGAYRKMRQKLGFSLDTLLRSGLAVRVKARPDFHERFGLKLIIEDIDPTYTLGQLELQRQETVKKLKDQGLIHLNQQLPMPNVVQHLAVISSEKAAGYQDFQDQLSNNTYGYRFFTTLFPSAMQGQQVEPEMLKQLKKINRTSTAFDAAVVIRGGGSRLDLEAFDRLTLCSAFAQLKIPVITGIGHEVDQSVLDMIAHTALKTPTAVAEFLINRNMQFEAAMLEMGQRIQQKSLGKIQFSKMNLEGMMQQLQFAIKNKLRFEGAHLSQTKKMLPVHLKQLLQLNQMKLMEIENKIQLLSPENILKRGYSLSMKGDRILTSIEDLKEGEEIKVQLANGAFSSKVTQKHAE